jgi:hypothetical protein
VVRRVLVRQDGVHDEGGRAGQRELDRRAHSTRVAHSYGGGTTSGRHL